MSPKKLTKKAYNGISLRTIHTLMVFGAVVLSMIMLYSTHYTAVSFQRMADVSEQNIELRKAALELMDASDYMTERVQRFTVTGNKQMLQEYYNEAFLMKHRDEAIEKMSASKEASAAFENLQQAMASSQKLMQREYYASKLVIEAKGIKDYPEPLRDVKLTESDMALSEDEKMDRAANLVCDNYYYSMKGDIRDNMQESLTELEKVVNETDDAAISDVKYRITFLRVMIVIETVAMFVLVWLASQLGINPIIKAVERIKSNKKIPEAGTSEFRYLVRAYNQMYEMYRESLRELDFKASHDELTGVYNRSGYETLLSSIEIDSTYMLLFDIDNFKSINDTYGHETGDKVLQKLVTVLKNNFRPDDFICRIGGDEFIVLMMRTPKHQHALIASKIEEINRELDETDDGLPKTSISVGIVHGSEAHKMDELFAKTDVAMYKSKQKGKHTYTFYSDEQQSDN